MNGIPKDLLKIVAVLIIVSAAIFGVLLFVDSCDSSNPNLGSIEEQTNHLRSTHQYFTNSATKEEVMIAWTQMFMDCEYQQNGIVNRGEWDCCSALISFVNRKFGANMAAENVAGLFSRISKYLDLKTLRKRTDFKSIKLTDLIIWISSDPSNNHIGMIITKSIGKYGKEFIHYLDVNVKTGTFGYKGIEYKLISKSNSGVYIIELGFDIWKGDLNRI